MKRKLILCACLLLVCLTGTIAQCDFPAPPGTSCPTATAFCNDEIDGYCSSTGNTGVGTNVGMPPFCGSVQNNQWIQFVAGTTTIDLEFTVTNCVNGDGLQAMVIHSDDCTNFTAASNCYTASTSGGGSGTVIFNLVGTNYTVGETYYVMIDGWLGDFCDYAISVVAGSTSLPPLTDPTTPSGDAVVCPGASGITYSIPALLNATSYDWTVPSGATFVENGNGESITVNFGPSATSGSICVEASNDCHFSNQVCFPVTVQGLAPTADYGEYCAGNTFYYPTNGTNYTAGTYFITLPGASFQGCDSTVMLEVTENPIQETFLIETICAGDNYELGGIQYTSTNQNIQATFSTYQNCDSTVYLDLTVLDPAAVIQTPDVLGCNSGTVLINAILSTADTYTWSTSTGNIVTGQGTPLLTVDAPGVYELNVSQTFNGVTCSASSSVEVFIDNQIPSLSISSTDVSCEGDNDGEASVSISGGVAPYTIQWSNGGNTNDISTLVAGNYVVTVTGDNGCSATQNVMITEPAALSLNTTTVDVSCNGGSNGQASVQVSGGTGPFNYTWSSGGNSDTETGLANGSYTVTVTDANGCSSVASASIAVPSVLSAASSQSNVSCAGGTDGTATVSVSGGTSPYSYLWNVPGQTLATATGLSAGNYIVTVTDAAGCTLEESFTLTASPALNLSSSFTNPGCSTSSDGTATVVPTGGAGNFSYQWNTVSVQTTATATGLVAGDYTVTVTDQNNCTAQTTVSLVAPTALSATTTQQDIACFGESTGIAEVQVSGGTAPYSYQWDDAASQTSAQATGLASGTYNVLITDTNGCTVAASVTLTQPAAALSANGTSTDATCGTSNGSIDLSVSGGTGPYTYAWSGGAASVQDPTNLGPGTYTVVVTDANNCTTNVSITVSTPSGLEAQVATSNVSCQGVADGIVDITVIGGLSPYIFVWSESTNNGNEDLTGVVAGNYSVTVTDNDGCSVVASAIISEPDLLTATASATTASCGTNDGSISLLVNGGTAPYTYSWSDASLNGQQSPSGLAPAMYGVTVTDANGCTVESSAEVIVPNGPVLSSSFIDVECFGGSNGSIDLTISGGTTPYTFSWDNGLPALEDQNTLTSGTYQVTVTDANNCSATTSIAIGEPAALSATIIPVATSCFGGNDGTASANVSGGTAPYTFAWSNSMTDADINGLTAGNYSLTVTDANNCTVESTIQITEPTTLSATFVATPADCFETGTGGIDLSVNGGDGTYSYTWSGSLVAQEDQDALSAGFYDVTISDGQGCTTTVSAIEITQPSAIQLTFSTQQASCNAANGGIDLNVSGGTAPYTFAWSDNLPATEDQSNLNSGSYDVTVTDGNGCTAINSINVSEPQALAISIVLTNVDCYGTSSGGIDLTVTGGQAPYSFDWNNGWSINEDLVGLTAGTYSLLLTDANGCTISHSEVISEPTELTTSATSSDASCGNSNGSIDLSVNGGVAPYTFQWSNGAASVEDPDNLSAGTYDLTVTDAQGCTLIDVVTVNTPNQLVAQASSQNALCFGEASGSIDLTVTGGLPPYTFVWSGGLGLMEDPLDVAAGDYTVIVNDAAGCSVLASVSVGEPTQIMSSAESADATCGNANGSIDLSITGGTPPYSFAWDNGVGNMEDPSGLVPGLYSVTIEDANGCTAVAFYGVNSPADLELDHVQFDVSCEGESDGGIDLIVDGGTAPYTYQWNTAETTQDLAMIPAGDYTVIVTDANDCEATYALTINEPPALEAIILDATDVNCNGTNTGGIVLDVTGGTAPYEFDWNEDAFDGQQSPQDLPAGQYIVTVTDVMGCNNIQFVQITQPEPIVLDAFASPASCYGEADAGINLLISGGIEPYSFNWNNGAYDTEDLTDIPAGQYSVEVTDDNGCTAFFAAQTGQPDPIEVAVEVASDYNGFDISCWDAADGVARAQASGGTAPYSYNWSSGTSGEVANELGAAAYELTVIDANACTTTSAVQLNAPSAPSAEVAIIDPLCFGERDGSIMINAPQGGIPPYSYALEDGAFSALDSFANLNSGVYLVSIEDANGCEWSTEVEIVDPEPLTVDLGGDFELMLGDSVELMPDVSVPDYALDTFIWAHNPLLGELDIWVRPFDSDNYALTVIDADGCIAFDEIQIRVIKERPVFIPTAFSPNNDGVNDYFNVYPGQSVARIRNFRVFSRWGELLFEALEYAPEAETDGWDGRLKDKFMNPGVFIYSLEVEYVDGRKETLSGDVTLIR